MDRVAVVAPTDALPAALVVLADAGVVDLDHVDPQAPAPDVVRRARVHGGAAVLLGWTPHAAVPHLVDLTAPAGAAVVPLRRPAGVPAPSLLRADGVHGSLAGLVNTYGPVPYEAVDPSVLAFVAYVLMFGMMFGDVGHGALLLVVAGLLRFSPRLARWRRAWPFVAGGGLAGMVFGLLYGECFGPTGLVPVLWLAPLEQPVELLAAGVGVGAVLLAGSLLLGAVNLAREGGWARALYAASGLAGMAVLGGAGMAAGGWYLGTGWLAAAGGGLAALGLALAFTGFAANGGGGPGALVQAGMRLADVVIGLGTALASFARLAAFGLTHAAIGTVVWQGTRSLGASAPLAAGLVLVVGTALAFVLEALVVAIQALRLEYYELFSRVFEAEGRAFRPWHPPHPEARPAPTEEVAAWSG